MNFPLNPLSNATKDHAQSHLEAAVDLADVSIQFVSDVAHLNIAATKASLNDSWTFIKQSLESKDLSKTHELHQAEVQPLSEKMISYTRHVSQINLKAHTAVNEKINSRLSETTHQFNSMITDIQKIAPADSSIYYDSLKFGMSAWQKTVEKLSGTGASLVDGYLEYLKSSSDHFAATPAKQTKPKKGSVVEENTH